MCEYVLRVCVTKSAGRAMSVSLGRRSVVRSSFERSIPYVWGGIQSDPSDDLWNTRLGWLNYPQWTAIRHLVRTFQHLPPITFIASLHVEVEIFKKNANHMFFHFQMIKLEYSWSTKYSGKVVLANVEETTLQNSFLNRCVFKQFTKI